MNEPTLPAAIPFSAGAALQDGPILLVLIRLGILSGKKTR